MENAFLTVQIKSRIREISALVIIFLSLILCYLTLDQISPTYDEPNYLNAAKKVVAFSDFSQQITVLHPPLTYWLNGLLLDWAPQSNMVDELRCLRILGLLAFYLITEILVFFWARKLFGPTGGLLSLVVFAFCPLIMAHARLATTDMAACCTFFAATFGLWGIFRRPTLLGTLGAGVLIGIALLAKYSTILLIPIAIFLFSAAMEARRKQKQRTRKKGVIVPDSTMPTGPRLPIVPFVLATVVGLAVLAAGYKFDGLFQSLSSLTFRSDFFKTLSGIPLINAIPLPVPQHYIEGIDFQKQISETGFTSFLLGEKYYRGVWYYYPVCFLLKMPIPFMILLGFGAWEFVRRKRVVDYERLFTILPPLLFFAYLVYPNTSNAGFRYAMPVIPFLAVLAGGVLRTRGSGDKPVRKKTDADEITKRSPIVATPALGATLGNSHLLKNLGALNLNAIAPSAADPVNTDPAEDPKESDGASESKDDDQSSAAEADATGWRRWWRPALVCTLCAWIGLSVALVHPHYLAWNNEFAGGPSNAYRLFAGSDLDWGQHNAAAQRYWDSIDDENRSLCPGILPVTGKILINTNELNDCLRPRDIHAWLRLFEPIDTIGYTWLVYSLGLDDFRQQAERDPDNLTACFALAGALLAEGRYIDCREELDRGLALKPDDGRLLFAEGILESRSKRKADAMGLLEKAVDAEPGLLEVYIPLRLMLIRAGRDRTEKKVRRAMIEAEIGQAHVTPYAPSRERLEKKAIDRSANLEELCTLSVLAWCDDDLPDSFRYARTAVAEDGQNIQALGNLLFLVTEHPRGSGSYLEALSLLAQIESLDGKTKAHSTPILRAGRDRIVFGPILTFPPLSRAQVEARFLLKRKRPIEAKELINTVNALLGEMRLAEAQILIYEGMKLFPENRRIRELNYVLDQQERGI